MYWFSKAAWATAPCTDEFLDCTNAFCNSQAGELMFNEFDLHRFSQDEKFCAYGLTIYKPQCVEMALKEIKPAAVSDFDCVGYTHSSPSDTRRC